MTELLRDPVWQFVGAVIALFATLITVLIFWAQRSRKSLSYEIISRIPVVSVSDEIEGKLRILFKGKPVKKVYLVIIRLTNSGNTPITSTDYERSISFRFHDGAKILTAEIVETSPQNLSTSVTLKGVDIHLEPVLLNNSDYITIQFLISQFDPQAQIVVNGRIIGVKEIIEKNNSGIQNTGMFAASGLISLLGVILILIAPRSPGRIAPDELPGSGIFLLGQIILLFALLRNRRYRNVIRAVFKVFFS